MPYKEAYPSDVALESGHSTLSVGHLDTGDSGRVSSTKETKPMTLRRNEHKLALVIAYPIAIVLAILFYIAKIISKLLFKFKKKLYKLSLTIGVVFFLTNVFGVVANAPKANASQPFEQKVVVSLPFTAHPDLKLRDTVLSLVRIEFGENQVNSFDNIVTHESGWDPQALNKSSGSCGLFQSLPCTKMHSMALEDQIAFGFNYIKNRYGTPNQAWAFWKEHNWY